MAIHCFAAKETKKALEAFQYDPKPLGPNDVEIKITHCGICHSDLHLINNDWGFTRYPLVPGHEIVGTVEAMGNQVMHLVKGQKVGVGWQRGSCLNCDSCVQGDENLCAKVEATCVGNYGGFAESIRTDSRFAFPIPDGMDEAIAAPLLCGGITVYSPLQLFEVRPSMRIGIVGVGGLGHLGIQFARAFGCEVFAFSSSQSKAAAAKELGAHEFVDASDSRRMKSLNGALDFVLSTAPGSVNLMPYFNVLKPKGKLCVVGVPDAPIQIPAFTLIGGSKSLVGSNIGGRYRIREMLEFAARNKIKTVIEKFPMSEVNAALARLSSNEVRYRAVLVNE